MPQSARLSEGGGGGNRYLGNAQIDPTVFKLGLPLQHCTFEGVNTKGAGGGGLLEQGDIREGDFSGQVELLSNSFSGDSASLSPICMSDLIL